MKKLLVVLLSLGLTFMAFASGAHAQELKLNDNEYVVVYKSQDKHGYYFELAIDNKIEIVYVDKKDLKQAPKKNQSFIVQFDKDNDFVSIKPLKRALK